MLPLTLAILDGISVKVGNEIFILPLVALHQVFDVEGACTELTQGIVTLLQTEGRRMAMLIDELVGQQQKWS